MNLRLLENCKAKYMCRDLNSLGNGLQTKVGESDDDDS
jgi:hypothetical protein